MSCLIRRVLTKPRLILDEMCRLYGKFASYLRRVLCKTRLIFPRINGPNTFINSLRRTTMKPKLGLVQQLWKGLRSPVIDVSVEKKQFAGLCTYFFLEFWLVGVLVEY